MVTQIGEGHLEWTMAAPLWRFIGDQPDSETRLSFRTPTILRFASDSFMNDFVNLLNTEPERLYQYIAAPETWSSPPGEPSIPAKKSGLALRLYRAQKAATKKLEARGVRVLGKQYNSEKPKILKLFQPAHQRYYLVATCLVCRDLGLPDRRIDTGALEKATFVLRLLQPQATADPYNPNPAQCNEFALVSGAWKKVEDPKKLEEGEEQHPLSPAAYTEVDHRRRRLLVGLIPVGDRERLMQAAQPNPQVKPDAEPLKDARLVVFETQVIRPLENLQKLANKIVTDTKPPDTTDPTQVALTTEQENARQAAIGGIVQSGNNQLQQISWLILLDFARYLEIHFNDLFKEITKDGESPATDYEDLWNLLSQPRYSGTTLLSALKQAYNASADLEAMTTLYPNTMVGDTASWPTFPFCFYTVNEFSYTVQTLISDPDLIKLEELITELLKNNPNSTMAVRNIAQASVNPQGSAWFTIRCVMERPNCGDLCPPLVSESTATFQMASFFDPDAPARPIRIGLPIDTTPAGLRKFDKNTAFIMSDTLCGQVSKMSGMSFGDLVMSVLPFPFHKSLDCSKLAPCSKNGATFGNVCSFSIPIITICALILLIIFVKLLDIIFFWMPFFQICLPLPNFKAKE